MKKGPNNWALSLFSDPFKLGLVIQNKLIGIQERPEQVVVKFFEFIGLLSF